MKHFFFAIIATLTLSMTFTACKKNNKLDNIVTQHMYTAKYASVNEDSLIDIYENTATGHNAFLQLCYASFMNGSLDTNSIDESGLNVFCGAFGYDYYGIPADTVVRVLSTCEAIDMSGVYNNPTSNHNLNAFFESAVISAYDYEPSAYDIFLRGKVHEISISDLYTDAEKQQAASFLGILSGSFEYWTDNYNRWHAIFNNDVDVYPGSPAEKPNNPNGIKQKIVRAAQADAYSMNASIQITLFPGVTTTVGAGYSAYTLIFH